MSLSLPWLLKESSLIGSFSLTDTKVESQPQPQAPTEPTVEQNATATTNPSAIGHQQPTEQTQQPSYLKQEAAFAQPQAQAPAQLQAQGQSPAQPQPHQQAQQQPQQIPQLPQQIPQQQQQQHQPFGMDHLTSAYSSYLPNQHPTGMSGFGMSPMGNLPDYGAYGTEAQRVAAMVRQEEWKQSMVVKRRSSIHPLFLLGLLWSFLLQQLPRCLQR